jgi:excisionase family DNA binding protein
MIAKSVSLPVPEEKQIVELYRMLELGAPVLVGWDSDQRRLPESVYRELQTVVRKMMAAQSTGGAPRRQRLTTQEAAETLGFSRPYLIKLLEAGVIPFEKVGKHRRVLSRDVERFQFKRDAERKAALNELARAEFADGMYVGTGIPEGGRNE